MGCRPEPTLLLALLATACAAPRPELRLPVASGFATAADFPAAAALLAGFDAPAAPGDDAWRAGDEVLYGLRLVRGDTVRHWLLHLRLTEPAAIARAGDAGAERDPLPPVDWSLRVNGVATPFTSARCRVLATVMDEHGTAIGRSEPLLPRDFLAHGFARACELVGERRAALAATTPAAGGEPGDPNASADGGDGGTDGDDGFYRGLDVQPFARATVAAVALLQVVQEDDVLAPLLWQVVEAPSVWSVLTGLGVRVMLRPRFHAAETMPSPAQPDRACWRVPMRLFVNDSLALLCDVCAVPSAPPFALCGGIVAALARHPTDPGVAFSLVLLGARRGPAPGR
jgi:hypothetical protein